LEFKPSDTELKPSVYTLNFRGCFNSKSLRAGTLSGFVSVTCFFCLVGVVFTAGKQQVYVS